MNPPHNKRLKRDCQRVAFPVPMSRGVLVVVFEFGVMRCQPLRRALCFLSRFGAIIGLTFIDSRCDMNRKVEAYGVDAVERPKIKASKKLDLTGDAGRQIVKSETKLALRTHQKTFTKLADM